MNFEITERRMNQNRPRLNRISGGLLDLPLGPLSDIMRKMTQEQKIATLKLVNWQAQGNIVLTKSDLESLNSIHSSIKEELNEFLNVKDFNIASSQTWLELRMRKLT
jgi:hypothetical protein